MARGGKRSGAGRKAGSISKRTQAIAEKAFERGMTPLEFMLDVMRDTRQEMSLRMDAAKASASYMHPRLAAVEVTGKDGGPIETKDVSDLERAQALALLLGKLKNR